MELKPKIQFLKNNEIDKSKWDKCIALADNGLIYAQTFYLDTLAARWNALAGEDYNWVMPLTYKRKFGITYLYQPPFTQQLGVFAKPDVIVPYQQILKYLQKHYSFWEINWNYTTPANTTNAHLQVSPANNFILQLNNTYEVTSQSYHGDLVSNLKKSKRFKHVYKIENDYKKTIELYQTHYGKRMLHVKKTDYKNFEKMCDDAQKNELLICRKIVDENNNLLSAALLLFDGRRLYNLMNTTTDTGKRSAANHFLLDSLIREFSAKKLILDFEGSDLPGVKHFYENFGAVNQPYFMYKYNNLPWPLKLFKR